MKKFQLWGSLVLVLILVAAGLYGWWALDLRWRPRTITKHQAEITTLLQRAGWVSPGAKGPVLYVICYRGCPDCTRLWLEEFPKYQKAGVDTRVIMVARPDLNGVAKSTPAERSTVAELWVNRNWNLFTSWQDIPAGDWPAAGIAPADTDAARSAVVEQSRQLVRQLKPLLAANGIGQDRFRYPTLIWWDKAGRMRGCACEKRPSYRFVRQELGA